MVTGPEIRAVGVDFGTSTSLLAQRTGLGRVELLPLGAATSWMPSVASQMGSLLLVGEDADSLPPDRIIFSAKRAITQYRRTIRIGAHEDGPEVDADEVILALLMEVGRRAAARGVPLGRQPLLRLGCPAIWDRTQRRRLLDLTGRAAVPVDHATLVDEPVAGGVAWLTRQYLTSPQPVEGRLLVFDMGGGTLDIAVLDVVGGIRPTIAVLASVGLPEAGDVLDERIADELTAALGIDLDALPDPSMARGALRRGAREAKVRLSTRDSFPVALSSTFFGTRVPAVRYTRRQLEEQLAPQLDNAEQMIWHALRIARLTHIRGTGTQHVMRTAPAVLATDVDYVLLCGGMSQIPAVRRRIRELFPCAQVFDDAGLAPDEAIVAGLADTVGYDGLSMHRPAFDVVLEWAGGREQIPLYEAYTPLYDGWRLQQGQSLLGHETPVDRRRLPRQGSGRLIVRSPDGEPVRLITGPAATPVDELVVPFGTHQVVFKLYVDGRLLLADGSGRSHELRVDGWRPVVGADSAAEPRPVADPPVYYPFNIED